ncbi:MAG: RNA polymerase factor sigma-54 [candidate division Zixibacteria bacterium]|nr:RNA polymerase factor sigma-54 [candidate division Zixibacteria bacterium]
MRLELGLRQKLTLAPQLIQSLKMLQMPLLKLEAELRQELSTNPMLEEVEGPETEEADAEQEQLNETETSESSDDDFDWENYLDEDSEFVPRKMSESPEESWERTPVVETSLYDHLTEQLKLSKLSNDELEIGEFIIGNIDPNGLLSMSVEELAEALKCPADKVDKVLKVVQGFDPPGVAARDLKEAILIQLDQRDLSDSLAAAIVREHWHELDRKTHAQLAKSLNVSIEKVREAMDELRTLSPRPAQGRFTTAALPVVPDLVVERVDDEYVIYHNDRHLPHLRITSAYKDIMRKGKKTAPETRKYVKDKLDQARWLLNAITQRRSTMTKVMEAIVEEQKEFFEKGSQFLKPLRMSDIADKVEMNVATVSRVSKEKYVQTPQGVREIKSFFSGGVETADGDSMSKRNVKTRLAELIDKENPAKPLSDQEIYKRLNAEGIKLARRTVTKYREELKIPAARFRKREATPENSNEGGSNDTSSDAKEEPKPVLDRSEINDGFSGQPNEAETEADDDDEPPVFRRPDKPSTSPTIPYHKA